MKKLNKIWLAIFIATSLCLPLLKKHEASETTDTLPDLTEQSELSNIQPPVVEFPPIIEFPSVEESIDDKAGERATRATSGPLANAKEDLGWPVEVLDGIESISGEYSFTPRADIARTTYSTKKGGNKYKMKRRNHDFQDSFAGSDTSLKFYYNNVGTLRDGTIVDASSEIISEPGEESLSRHRYNYGTSLATFLGGRVFTYKDHLEMRITFYDSSTGKAIPNLKGHLSYGVAWQKEAIAVHKDYIESIYVPPTGVFQGKEFAGTKLMYDTSSKFNSNFYTLTQPKGSDIEESDLSNFAFFTFKTDEKGQIVLAKRHTESLLRKKITFSTQMPFRVNTIPGYIEGEPNETENGTYDYVIKQPISPRSQGFYYETVEFNHKINDKLIVAEEDVKVVDIDKTDLTEYYNVSVDENNNLTVTLKPESMIEAMSKTLYEINVEIKASVDSKKLTPADIVVEGSAKKTYLVLETGDASVKLDEGKIYAEAYEMASTTSKTNWPTGTIIEASDKDGVVIKGEGFSREFKWKEISVGPVNLYYKLNGKEKSLGQRPNEPVGDFFSEELVLTKDDLKIGINEVELYALNNQGRKSNVIKFKISVTTQVTVRYLDSYNEPLENDVILKGIAGVDSYETEEKEFTGYDLTSAPSAAEASGKFPNDHIIIEYKYKGILAVQAPSIHFGNHELSATPKMIAPEEDTTLVINDYLHEGWDITLAIGKYLADGDTPLIGELQFGKKDGGTVILNKESQSVYTKKAEDKGNYTITWNRAKGEGVKLQQHAGNVVGHYDGELVWFVQNTPENK